ncbi:hypothetical protein D6D00_10122 [Aureobasidium pullulans]|nr:hypothetical protein D6D00_10122 [Aureobasidium pullulans]
MIGARSITDFWQISSEGAFSESAAPQPHAGLQAQALTSYQMKLAAADRNTTEYEKTLEVLRTSIDKQLYSDLSGAYFVSDAQAQGIAQDANAMAILANVPQGNHTALSISQAMSRLLFVDHGALPFSDRTTGFSKLISPYA